MISKVRHVGFVDSLAACLFCLTVYWIFFFFFSVLGSLPEYKSVFKIQTTRKLYIFYLGWKIIPPLAAWV